MTRGQLLRAELGETADHALRAAGHAAGGVRAAVQPRVASARQAMAPTAEKVRSTFAPLTEAAQATVKDAKRRAKDVKRKAKDAKRKAKSGRRWPVVAGLLAAGVATGAVAAMVLRRRRQAESEEEVLAPELPSEPQPVPTADLTEPPEAPPGQPADSNGQRDPEHQAAG